jgi:hypothetical protein
MGLVEAAVGVIVGVIMFVAVAIPVTISVIGTANMTGDYEQAGMVAKLIPLGLSVGALIIVFGGVSVFSG